ncbi:MAG: LEA type 2 family protein [Kofleriaceae bacterium]
MRPLLHRLALLALCAPVAACFLARPVEQPTATVRAVNLELRSLTAVGGDLTLDVHNPNSFSLPVTSLDWELSVGGARAVIGQAALSQTLPAMGSAPVTTALAVDLRAALDAASAVARGARDYQLAVRLHVSTRLGDLTVDVVHRGTLSGGGILGALRR